MRPIHDPRTPLRRHGCSVPLPALAAIAVAIISGCGGRGGYQADRTVPALEDRVRDVQRTQDEIAKQGSRNESRVYDLQVKVGQLVEQLRQTEARCLRGNAPVPAAAPAAAPAPWAPPSP